MSHAKPAARWTWCPSVRKILSKMFDLIGYLFTSCIYSVRWCIESEFGRRINCAGEEERKLRRPAINRDYRRTPRRSCSAMQSSSVGILGKWVQTCLEVYMGHDCVMKRGAGLSVTLLRARVCVCVWIFLPVRPSVCGKWKILETLYDQDG